MCVFKPCYATIWIYKEPTSSDSLNKIRIKGPQAWIKNLTEPAMNWWFYMAGYWIFSKTLRTVIIYQNQLFEFLRTMVLNLKNLHDKCQGLFLFLTTAQHHWFKPWGKVQLPFKCEPLPYTMIKHHIVAKWHFLSLYNIIITRLVRTNQEK